MPINPSFVFLIKQKILIVLCSNSKSLQNSFLKKHVLIPITIFNIINVLNIADTVTKNVHGNMFFLAYGIYIITKYFFLFHNSSASHISYTSLFSLSSYSINFKILG